MASWKRINNVLHIRDQKKCAIKEIEKCIPGMQSTNPPNTRRSNGRLHLLSNVAEDSNKRKTKLVRHIPVAPCHQDVYNWIVGDRRFS